MASVSSDSAIEDNVFEKSGPGEPVRVDESDMNGPLTTSSPRRLVLIILLLKEINSVIYS